METSLVIPTDAPSEGHGSEPTKCVRNAMDVAKWTRSAAYHDLLGFVNGISSAVQGRRLTEQIHISEQMAALLKVIETLNLFLDEAPPIEQPQRFGNKAFRDWSRRKNEELFRLLSNALPQEKCGYFKELAYYLCESFGNAVRIDYGTGHELSFVFFMCALFKAEILKDSDSTACGLRLFGAYLSLVRRLQRTYRMEPAGSQGVWALDDFQFIPFIWGSAQLAMGAPFEPGQFLDEEIINEHKDDYMFISCIAYIKEVKTGHFAEHSNQLWGISGVPSWQKINSGLVKMYQKEILGKFPIIQHVYFGELMSFDAVKPGASIPNACLGFRAPQASVAPSTTQAEKNSQSQNPPP